MGSDTPWALAVLRSRGYESVRQVGPAVAWAVVAFQLLLAPFVLNTPFPQFIRRVARYVGWAALIEQEELREYTGLFYALVAVAALSQAYRVPSQFLLRWLRGAALLVMACAAALASVLFIPVLRLAVAGFVCDTAAGFSWMRALPGTPCEASSGTFVATVVLASAIVCAAVANALFFTSSSSDMYAKARQHDLSLMALRSEAFFYPLVVVAAQVGVALCLVFLPPSSIEDSRIGGSVLTGLFTSLLIVTLRLQPFQHHGTNRWVAVCLTCIATTALASFIVALIYNGTPAVLSDSSETSAWFTLVVLLLLLPAVGYVAYRCVAKAQVAALRRLVHARAGRGSGSSSGASETATQSAGARRRAPSWWVATKAGGGRLMATLTGDPKYSPSTKYNQEFGTGTSHRSAILMERQKAAGATPAPGTHSGSLAPSSAALRSASAALAGSIVDLRESLVGCSQAHFFALHTELAAAPRIAAVLLASNHLRASSLRLILSALTSNPTRILHTLDLSGNPFVFYEESEPTPVSTYIEGVVRYALPPEQDGLGNSAATEASNAPVHAGLMAALRSFVASSGRTSRNSRRSSATVAPLTLPSSSPSPPSGASVCGASQASSTVTANGSQAGAPIQQLQSGRSTSRILTEQGSVPQLVVPSNSFSISIPNTGSAGALAATQGAGSALGATTPAVAVLLERLAAATGPSPLSPPWTRPYAGPSAPVRVTGLVPALLCCTSLRVLVLDGCIIRASTMRALCDAMGEMMAQGAEGDESGSTMVHSGGGGGRAGRQTSSTATGSAFFDTELDTQGGTLPTEQGTNTRSGAGGANGNGSSSGPRTGRPSIARPGIRTLSMWGCSLTPEALIPLAALLAKTGTCTIEHLNLSGNWMGPNAGPILAAALRNNHVICSCDLTWNNLGVEGVRTVMAALPHDGRYIEIKLHCNAVDHKALASVKEALATARASAAANANKAASFPGKQALHVLEAVQEVATTANHTMPEGESLHASTADFRAIEPPLSPTDEEEAEAVGELTLEQILRDPATGRQRTLFEFLGGEAAISAVVDTFYLYLVTDPLVGPRFFRHVTMSPMRAMQTDFIVQLTGGPARYHGRDMFTAHRSLGITDDDFDAVCDHLVAALLYHAPSVPAPVVAAIGGAVDSLRNEVVTRSVDGKPLNRRNRVSFTDGTATQKASA